MRSRRRVIQRQIDKREVARYIKEQLAMLEARQIYHQDREHASLLAYLGEPPQNWRTWLRRNTR